MKHSTADAASGLAIAIVSFGTGVVMGEYLLPYFLTWMFS